MGNEKIIFETVIAGKQMSVKIEKEQEMAHRQANELLNKYCEMYKEANQAMPREDILAMTAYSLAVQVVDLENLWKMMAKNS